MPKRLPDTEIKRRLQQLRNMTVLHARALARISKLEVMIKQRDELLACKDTMIAELQTKLQDKEAQRRALSAKLWKSKKDRASEVADQAGRSKPGAQVGHEAHRRRPTPLASEVTDRQIFDLAKCPACKNTVGDVVDTVEKYQEDIDIAPRQKIVRHYTITRHWCPHCHEYVRPIDTPAQNLRRFGPNVLGYILYARYRLRLPLLMIQESLRDLHDFDMSEGEIQIQLDDARELFGEQYDLICELIRSAKVVYADESGWRMDGDNWYIWAFVDKASGCTRYELVETRGGATAKAALGGTSDQVIVSDGYSVYNSMDSPNQQCWIHLIRIAKEKAGTAKLLYGELCAVYTALLLVLSKPNKERTTQEKQAIRQQLAAVQTKDYNSRAQGKTQRVAEPLRAAEPLQVAEPLQREVQARIAKHFDQLLVCLDHDDVLPENNTAERAIRPQVILRKIFGGNRSPTGAKTHAVNTSVITTKLTQNPGKSFFDVMLPLLNELHQQPKIKKLSARHQARA